MTGIGPVARRSSAASAKNTWIWSSVTSGRTADIGAPTLGIGPLGCGGRRSRTTGTGALGCGGRRSRTTGPVSVSSAAIAAEWLGRTVAEP